MPDARPSAVGKLPSPPVAWSAMLSCRIFRDAGVSGASCPKPQGLVWSCDGWPGTPPTTNRSHWPFQSGYFGSSDAHALPNVATDAAAINKAVVARTHIAFRHDII